MLDLTNVLKQIAIHSVFVAGLLTVQQLHAGKNGKGKGDGGSGDTSPTVMFQPITFSLPDPLGYAGPANSYGGVINNRLQIAGSYTTSAGAHSAFFYDPQVDASHSIDLNVITQNVPDGFAIRAANGINELGNIAVVCVSDPSLRFSDPANEVLTGVVNTSAGFEFSLVPLPSVVYDETDEYAEPMGINNSNDLLIVSRQIENGIREWTTYVAFFDEANSTWSLEAIDPLSGFRGVGISDRLAGGDLFVVGNAADATTRNLLSYPVRVNLINPGAGEVVLSEYSEAGTDYRFVGPFSGTNSYGEFLGRQIATTTTTKGKRTTTVVQESFFKFTNQVQADSLGLQYPSKLNNQLDYFANLIFNGREVLSIDGSDSYIDIVDSIDFTSAPEINWEAAETTTEFRSITDRIDVGSDSDPANDLPIIFGYAEVERGPYTAISSKPILLVPVLSN
ncbi:hypothetical protein LOC67_11995 [Stieleria sp. JC731]|uniref:hypothetical protein n=1 Tax=Pirellulaceae TaxID=2691357 RepID=UPI001E491D12|nr:hypothetical protein [Stieleria sp. JC731]MCC9601270.1 hypothetical protein [Stieleria sp. JC731]